MTLPYDITRCVSQACPRRMNCARQDIPNGGYGIPITDLYQGVECGLFISNLAEKDKP